MLSKDNGTTNISDSMELRMNFSTIATRSKTNSRIQRGVSRNVWCQTYWPDYSAEPLCKSDSRNYHLGYLLIAKQKQFSQVPSGTTKWTSVSEAAIPSQMMTSIPLYRVVNRSVVSPIFWGWGLNILMTFGQISDSQTATVTALGKSVFVQTQANTHSHSKLTDTWLAQSSQADLGVVLTPESLNCVFVKAPLLGLSVSCPVCMFYKL